MNMIGSLYGQRVRRLGRGAVVTTNGQRGFRQRTDDFAKKLSPVGTGAAAGLRAARPAFCNTLRCLEIAGILIPMGTGLSWT
jgi:hypothetical protein